MNSRNSKFFDLYNNKKSFWDCKCGNKICGYKDKCQKCGFLKDGTSDKERNSLGDWLCKKCNFFVFRDKEVCDCKK